jgi:hypothetical protein
MGSNGGWSKQKPTVYIGGERDRIDLQSGKIKLTMGFPNLACGIMPFINQFGKLWSGTLTQSYFENRFRHERSVLVNNLKSLGETSSQYILQKEKNNNSWFDWKSTVFYMWMCRVAQKESWQWPVLSHEPNFPDYRRSKRWTAGTSRFIATAITRPNPWEHLPVLHFSKNTPDTEYLNVQTEIQSDEMLHKIFHVEFDDTQNTQEVLVNWNLSLEPDNTINMAYINNGKFHEDVTTDTIKIWDNYFQWRSLYSFPKIKIYTNWPNQIYNRLKSWDIVEIESNQHILDEIQEFGGRTGRLERWAIEEHNRPTEIADHILYVIDPRPIELSDLLVWMDAEHNTYIESTWKFLLYRKADVYKTTYIDTSYIMQ